MEKLHIGSGLNKMFGWLNIDLKFGDVVADARKKLPFEDARFDFIFSEHMLEHLDYPKEANQFMSECLRVLKPEGVVRIGVPDGEYAVRAYVQNDAAYFEMCRKLWHPKWCETPFESVNHIFRQNGDHKFAYDFDTMKKLMLSSGFSEVERGTYMSSKYKELQVDHWPQPGTLYVEAKKADRVSP
jgi:predicted SAM-dependent methyltransferase